MKENDIFYENDNWDEKADWCNASGKYHIEEIEPDENGRRFKIVKNPEPTAEELAQEEIYECLQYLKSTDYIASKLAEANSKYIASGDNSEVIALMQHYATELETRESKRVRIRELENI